LVQFDDDGDIIPDSVIPLIDGGTEGFSGQARVFIPRVTSCFECSIASMAEEEGHFQLCTLADVPRIPEHCIQYVLVIMWPLLEEFKSVDNFKLYEKKDKGDEFTPNGVRLDKDDVNHMTWIFLRATERANKFGIKGVTFHLTQQVVKRIIPAIASTNALIAAACVNEALKYRTRSAYLLNNYLMYMGQQQTGTHSDTFRYKRNPNCKHCKPPFRWTFSSTDTLQQLLTKLTTEGQLDHPSVASDVKMLFESNFPDMYTEALTKPLKDFVAHNGLLKAFDREKRTQKIVVKFKDT